MLARTQPADAPNGAGEAEDCDTGAQTGDIVVKTAVAEQKADGEQSSQKQGQRQSGATVCLPEALVLRLQLIFGAHGEVKGLVQPFAP